MTYEGIANKDLRGGAMTDKSVCWGLHNATRNLRDRWLRETRNTRHVSRLDREISSTILVNEIQRLILRRTRKPKARLPRKIALDESDNEDDEMLPWVPYVHFGV